MIVLAAICLDFWHLVLIGLLCILSNLSFSDPVLLWLRWLHSSKSQCGNIHPVCIREFFFPPFPGVPLAMLPYFCYGCAGCIRKNPGLNSFSLSPLICHQTLPWRPSFYSSKLCQQSTYFFYGCAGCFHKNPSVNSFGLSPRIYHPTFPCNFEVHNSIITSMAASRPHKHLVLSRPLTSTKKASDE